MPLLWLMSSLMILFILMTMIDYFFYKGMYYLNSENDILYKKCNLYLW